MKRTPATEQIEITPLTPDLWPQFEELFGANGACGGCWCMLWRVPSRDWDACKGRRNKAAMRALVRRGPPPGVLAFLGGRPVGWCATAPREQYVRLATSRAMKPVDDTPVWSVSCLFVSREHRRLGLSRHLLKGAAQLAQAHGARLLEGYPIVPAGKSVPDAFAWTGLESAYRRAGFREVHRWLPTRPIMRLKLLAAIALTLACAPAQSFAQTKSAEKASPFAEWFAGQIEKRLGAAAVGASWVVTREGKTLFEGAAGYASVSEPKVRMTPGSRMQIASASKPITAMALLAALRARAITVDTPFTAVLGDSFAPLGSGVRDVTIRQLLTHRSGWPFAYIQAPRLENTRKLLSAAVPNPPGDSARYSNINFSLARTLIEVLSGEPYGAHVERTQLAPSGIKGATLTPLESDVHAHPFDSAQRSSPLRLDFADEAGAYGWYMSARDLAAWGTALRTGRLLAPSAVSTAFGEGLGWGTTATVAGPAYTHQGQWNISGGAGVRTAIAMLPDSVVAVLFVNTNLPIAPPSVLVGVFNLAVPAFAWVTKDSGRIATVHITTPASASVVRYTLDGSEPTAASPLYVRPLVVRTPLHLRARGFTDDSAASFAGVLRVGTP